MQVSFVWQMLSIGLTDDTGGVFKVTKDYAICLIASSCPLQFGRSKQ